MKIGYVVNENNIYCDVVELDESNQNDIRIITTQLPQGLYRAKWIGTKWVEDMTQEEIDELNSQPNEPTEIELLEQRINELELYILMQEGLI